VAQPLASAFGNTFWWAIGMSLVALVPAVVLMRETGRRPSQDTEPAPETEPARAAA